jgi:pimeloyl-ACP methyl ester carboxylesterase
VSVSEFVELADGRRFGLACYGATDGQPVLALHGAPASRIMFDVTDRPAKELGLRLFCPERPGYGVTPKDKGATLETRAADLEVIADRLGLKRFAVLGVSGGGPYAVALAERLQTRVSGLALVSPMGPLAQFMAAKREGTLGGHHGTVPRGHRLFFLELPKRRRLLALQAGIGARAFKAAPHSFAKIFARLLSRSDTRVLSQPHVEKSLVAMTVEALRQGVGGGMADLAIFSQPWPVDFQQVTAPSILWQGTADRIVPVAVSAWLAELLPNCRFERLEGAGHFWVYDHAGEVLKGLAEISR